jgi:hypothetical protein
MDLPLPLPMGHPAASCAPPDDAVAGEVDEPCRRGVGGLERQGPTRAEEIPLPPVVLEVLR